VAAVRAVCDAADVAAAVRSLLAALPPVASGAPAGAEVVA
jgi:hypothetical protein